MLTIKKATEYGYYARYEHAPDEPGETLTMAIRIAAEITADEARKTRKTPLCDFNARPDRGLRPAVRQS